jgi:hypothetical protein
MHVQRCCLLQGCCVPDARAGLLKRLCVPDAIAGLLKGHFYHLCIVCLMHVQGC